MSLSFRTERGSGFLRVLDALGELRIRVFRDWPYLYEGDLDYERKYLKTYVEAPTSFGFFVYDGEKMVGATTAIELHHESAEFQKPFLDHRIPIDDVVYFGESILLSEYRRQGVGKRFMQERLQYARNFGTKKWASFCAVIRDTSHPLKPLDYEPLEGFWRTSGFSPRQGMVASLSWKDLDKNHEDKKQLQFWLQELKKEKP